MKLASVSPWNFITRFDRLFKQPQLLWSQRAWWNCVMLSWLLQESRSGTSFTCRPCVTRRWIYPLLVITNWVGSLQSCLVRHLFVNVHIQWIISTIHINKCHICQSLIQCVRSKLVHTVRTVFTLWRAYCGTWCDPLLYPFLDPVHGTWINRGA